MPGRLLMETTEPRPIIGLKRDGSHLGQPSDGPQQKRIATPHNVPPPTINGVSPAAQDFAVQHATRPAAKDDILVKLEPQDVDHDPPPIHDDSDAPPQLERFRETLIPFGKMLERQAQFAYFQLSELLESLSDIEVRATPNVANGFGSQVQPDKSADSVNKKLRILNFAQENKDRFIKALVLSDWARNMDDMGQLIDVSMMLRKQDWATTGTADSLWHIKENMVPAKMPNPNIEGALELLSTGEASWLPDMDYLPPKHLSAHELLETFEDMNFALRDRLELHEQPPSRFSDFSIANGRATFKVRGEFEVDLAIADEDHNSPFYFIDLRLDFSPVSQITTDRLRDQLEAQANQILATSGLKGCYDFLHNFVLSHKLNVLRSQAHDLSRGRWTELIDVQSIHRSLIVHYWTKRPGGKNWIELGIKSAGSKAGHATASTISCRWFRRGQEVVDHDLKLDLDDLSMERFLDQVTGQHCFGRLNALLDSLTGAVGDSGQLATSLDATEDGTPRLCVSLHPSPTVLNIVIDAFHGGLVVSPVSRQTIDLQHRLNSVSSAEQPQIICAAICRILLNQVSEQATTIGLRRVNVDASRTASGIFTRNPPALGIFQRPQWSDSLSPDPLHGLAICIDPIDGFTFFLVDLAADRDIRFIRSGSRVLDETSIASSPTIERILEAEREAVKLVSRQTILRELEHSHIKFEQTRAADRQRESESSERGSRTAYILLADLYGCSPDPSASIAPPVFGDLGDLLLDPQYDGDEAPGLRFFFRTTLRREVESAKALDLLRRSLVQDEDMHVGAHGEISVSARCRLGESIVPLLRARLDSVARLYNLLSVTLDNHYAIVRADSSQITFQYSPKHICTYNMQHKARNPNVLTFTARDQSQDIESVALARTQSQLQSLFEGLEPGQLESDTELDCFNNLCQHLRAAQPILDTAATLETLEPVGSTYLSCHTAGVYRLAYKAPLSPVSFLIASKPRHGRLSWTVKVSNMGAANDDCKRSIAFVFRDRGPGWEGLKNMAMAALQGIAALLTQIDRAVREPAAYVTDAQGRIGMVPAGGAVPAQQQQQQSRAPVQGQAQMQTLQQGQPGKQRSGSMKTGLSAKEAVVLD